MVHLLGRDQYEVSPGRPGGTSCWTGLVQEASLARGVASKTTVRPGLNMGLVLALLDKLFFLASFPFPSNTMHTSNLEAQACRYSVRTT